MWDIGPLARRAGEWQVSVKGDCRYIRVVLSRIPNKFISKELWSKTRPKFLILSSSCSLGEHFNKIYLSLKGDWISWHRGILLCICSSLNQMIVLIWSCCGGPVTGHVYQRNGKILPNFSILVMAFIIHLPEIRCECLYKKGERTNWNVQNLYIFLISIHSKWFNLNNMEIFQHINVRLCVRPAPQSAYDEHQCEEKC